ncbi:MAG: sulfatase [Bacteroidota bacterium]
MCNRTNSFIWISLATYCWLVFAACVPAQKQSSQPNILFIAVDDLNDWVGHLGGHPQARTPNIDRLAKQGVSFSRAYCAAPLCNPSRISLLTGIRPSSSGVYGNGERLRDKLPDATTLMQYLQQHGYSTQGGGKIFHGTKAYDPDSWDFYFTAKNHKRAVAKRQEGLSDSAWAPWGPLEVDDEEMFDTKVVNWTISQLQRSHDKPFFLACGFTKPHLPWFAPQQYFDLHPLDSIILPETLDDDRDDLPAWGKKFAREVHDVSGARNFATHGEDHDMVLKYDQWHRAVQAYLATISYSDAQIGRLLDALESSEYADNTIVVLWGDHGWHLGEKQHWRKHALWEVTTRTPLIIVDPTTAQQDRICDRAVSLIDLYPTLLDLCSLPNRSELAGQSLVPLLRNPDIEWERPVLMTFGYQNHAVQTESWRYIQYNDGGEELYDHRKDPNEWHNLAAEGSYQSVIQELQGWLPKVNQQ